ncbi:MAG: hypothetical protein ACJ8AT_37810 [Hyalangium sp.]|uniref:hypothetical protein n=1 Tax=Hyalangium sp. TaxID=2028555 RepID=UPI00389B0B5E
MTVPSSSNEELRVLRLAADRGDWNGCRTASEKLLLRITCRHAVGLIREQVARRLPAFERHHPNVHWPREFIESTDAEPAHIARTWPETEDEFRGPGGNNFTSAVEALWKASRLTNDERQCTLGLVDALAGAIMAESTEHWGSRHPKEWALWYQLSRAGEDDPRIIDIQLTMRRDSEVKSIERTAWLEAADQLEAALRET